MYSVAIAILIVLSVPGPTNSLLLQSGVSRGLGGYSLKLVLAEWMAYLIQITAWGISIDALTADYSWVMLATKSLAVVFLFYIALKLWFSGQEDVSGTPSAISIPALFLATLTNPKGLFFATFVAPVGTFLHLENYLSFMLIFSLVIFPVGLLWVGLGAVSGRHLPSVISTRRVNRGVSLVIGGFASVMFYNLALKAIVT